MEKNEVIGLYKFLSEGEEVIFEGNSLTPIIRVKEAVIKKKVLNREERREIPIAMYEGKLYLTTKRIIFLTLHQRFSHDYDGHFVAQDYLGVDKHFYDPTEEGVEQKIKDRVMRWRALQEKAKQDGD